MVQSTCTSLTSRLGRCFVPNTENGRLMVLEGIPGAGKTTALHRVSKMLGAVMVSQLDHTTELSGVMYDEAQRWYVVAEIERQEFIRASLATSTKVIQDRNIISTLAFAYASAKRYGESKYFTTTLRMILRETPELLVRPNVLMVLMVDPAVGLLRRRKLSGEPLDQVWRDDSFLKYHAEFYTELACLLPADVVITLDTTDLTPEDTALTVAQAMRCELSGARK